MAKLTVTLDEVRNDLATKHNLAPGEITIEGVSPISVSPSYLGEQVRNLISLSMGHGKTYNKIAMIKAYRTITGASLFDAKTAVERAIDDANVPF